MFDSPSGHSRSRGAASSTLRQDTPPEQATCRHPGEPMKLVAHVIDGHHVDIRPAPVERDWMEATNQRYAYRCLPLNIANAYGWEVLCNAGLPRDVERQDHERRDHHPGRSRHDGARHQPFRPWHPDLPSAVPIPHRARRRADGAGADQPAEGRDRGARPASSRPIGRPTASP